MKNWFAALALVALAAVAGAEDAKEKDPNWIDPTPWVGYEPTTTREVTDYGKIREALIILEDHLSQPTPRRVSARAVVLPIVSTPSVGISTVLTPRAHTYTISRIGGTTSIFGSDGSLTTAVTIGGTTSVFGSDGSFNTISTIGNTTTIMGTSGMTTIFGSGE